MVMDDARPLADKLPERERADHEVAVGGVAGLIAGFAMWLVACLFARGDQGFLVPVRLVAASVMGPAALDTGAVFGPAVIGVLLIALASVLCGLIFTSILSDRLDVFGAVLVGLLYAGALWLVSWFVVVRVVDPLLFAAATALYMLLLHLIYGVALGFLVPFLRKALP